MKNSIDKQCITKNSVDEPVFYVDEADIDLNPKIGADWMRCHNQKRLPTPGKNEKHNVAVALNSQTGKVVYTTGTSKNSVLFIQLLETLKRHYRRVRIGQLCDPQKPKDAVMADKQPEI